MSVAAPTTLTVTGGASLTITLAAWSTAGGATVFAAILAYQPLTGQIATLSRFITITARQW